MTVYFHFTGNKTRRPLCLILSALLGLLMYQKSWMLKLLAIELRINALTNQRLGLQSLARRLIGNSSEGDEERPNWFEQITAIGNGNDSFISFVAHSKHS